MGENLDTQIRKLQEFYWSDADPEGRGFVSLAELYRRAGDLPEAHRLLRDGLARHGRLASGHVVLGWVYLDQGSSTEAEAAFRAALSVDPENLGALRGLGTLLLERDDSREALAVHRKLERLDPLNQDVAGRIREMEGRAEASALSPDAQHGNTRQDISVWEDGAAAADSLDWEMASVQADRSPEAGAVTPSDGDEDVEGEDASVSAAPSLIHGKDSLVTRTMGEIYLRQGLLDEARRVFEILLEDDPENELLRTRLREVDAAEEGEGEEPGFPEHPAAELATEEEEGRPGEVMAVQELGPDRIAPIEELEPDAVTSVAALAPDLILSVTELAPETIVPVADLSPEVILPVQDLAPDTLVPIQDLAPGPGVTDPRLDDFEAWLDRLP